MRRLILTAVITLSAAPSALATPFFFSGVGAGATTQRDNFRTAIGGGNVAGADGSFGGIRREINWDGVPAAQSAPNTLAANFFNVNSPRGVVFTTAGTAFEVSGATTDGGAGQPAAANFGNINPTYSATFATFSPQRLFTPIGSNVMDVSFFVPGTTNPAATSAFGAIFTDVDLANTTSLEFFNLSNVSLGTFFVQNVAGASQTPSFLGVQFSEGPVVSRVRITTGNSALGAGVNDGGALAGGGTVDVAALDDFLFAEPTVVPEPASLILLGTGAGALLARRRRRAVKSSV